MLPMPAASRWSGNESFEYDNWTGEDIQQTSDPEKLRKASAYFREHSCYETALIVETRLKEVLHSNQNTPPFNRDSAEARSHIDSFQEEARQRSILGKQATRLQHMPTELHPPVRGADCARRFSKRNSKESDGAAVLRQSLDLKDIKDQQQLLGPEGLKIPAQGTAPKAAAAAADTAAEAAAAMAAALGLAPEQAPKSKKLVQEIKPKAFQRTQQLLEQNMQLPAADRLNLAEQKRNSGNDFFRAGAYAEAVEEYTLSIGVNPAGVPSYTNRAAAYLKLKQWQAAVDDCNMALDFMEGGSGRDQELALKAKALMRRAEALVALGSNDKALKDYEAVLVLFPDEPKAQQGAARARTALGIKPAQPGLRRIHVVEAEGSSSDEEEEAQQQQHSQNRNSAEETVPSSPSLQQQGAAALQQQQQEGNKQTAVLVGEDSSGNPAVTYEEALGAEIQPTTDAVAHNSSGTSTASLAVDSASSNAATASAAAEGALGATEPMLNAFDSSRQDGSGQVDDAPTTGTDDSAGVGAAALAASLERLMSSNNQQHDQQQQPLSVQHSNNATGVADGHDDSSSSDGGSGGSSGSSRQYDDAEAEPQLDAEDALPESLAAAEIQVVPEFDSIWTELKDSGNKKFKAGAYSEAMALYTQALTHAPDVPLVYVNRAMAALALNKFEQAHEDASMAIALQADNYKAYHKRHKAKSGLKDYMGAKEDLKVCMQQAPKAWQPQLEAEMNELHQQAEDALQAALSEAHAAEQASSVEYSSCVITEVGDNPVEVQQRLFNDLQEKEQYIARAAAKQTDLAAQQRLQHEQTRQQQLLQQQQQQQLLEEWRIRQEHKREQLEQRAKHIAERRAARVARRQAKAAATAAAAAAQPDFPAEVLPGSSNNSSAAIEIVGGHSSATPSKTAAASAEGVPPTPPASPFDSKLIHNMAARAAARAGAAAYNGSCLSSTPTAMRMAAAATPAVTPAGSYVAPSSMLPRQQQQWHAPAAPTPAQVHDQVALQVEALKDRGNALLQQGDLSEAESAYIEALQLDGENVKVLLNLAMLRIKQSDGRGAVRCCEEVLAQQNLPEQARLKALVRCGLGFELLGDFAAALQHLSAAAEENRAAGGAVDEQLARDIARVASKVQRQVHQQQHAGSKPECTNAESAAAVAASTPGMQSLPAAAAAAVDGVTHANGERTDEQQQRLQEWLSDQVPGAAVTEDKAVPVFTGMRASIPVVITSETESESETEQTAETQDKSGHHDATPLQQRQEGEQAVSGFEQNSSTGAVVDKTACALPDVEQQRENANELAAAAVAASSMDKQQHRQQCSRELGEVDGDTSEGGRVASAIDTHQRTTHSVTEEQAVHQDGSTTSSSSSSSSSVCTGGVEHLQWNPLVPTGDEAIDDVAAEQHWQGSLQQQRGQQQQQKQQPQRQSPGQPQRAPEEQLQQLRWEAERQQELDSAELALVQDALKSIGSNSGKVQHDLGRGIRELGNTAATQCEAADSALRQGSTQTALKHYNAALAASPKDPRIYAGRALVWLKLKRWQHALEDCNTALLLAKPGSSTTNLIMSTAGGVVDASLVRKVRHRKALALKELGNWVEAIAQVKLFLAESPTDNSFKRLMDDLKQAYTRHLQQTVQEAKTKAEAESKPSQQHQGKQKHSNIMQESRDESALGSSTTGASAVQPAAAAAAAVQSEPAGQVHRHRIVIEESDGSASDSDGDGHDNAALQTRHHILPQLQQQAEKDTAEPMPRELQTEAKLNGAAAADAGSVQPSAAVQPIGVAAAPAVHSSSAATTAAAPRLVQKQQLLPPKAAMEFQTTAKKLAAPQALGQYVRLLEPSSYKAVFKHELNEGIIKTLVSGFQELIKQEHVFVGRALLELSKVERFSIVLQMTCVNKGTKTALQSLLQQLEAQGHDITQLKGLYKSALK